MLTLKYSYEMELLVLLDKFFGKGSNSSYTRVDSEPDLVNFARQLHITESKKEIKYSMYSSSVWNSMASHGYE